MSFKIKPSIFDFTDKEKCKKYKIWEKIPITLKKNEVKLIEGILFKKSKKTGFWKQKVYALYNDKLVAYEVI